MEIRPKFSNKDIKELHNLIYDIGEELYFLSLTGENVLQLGFGKIVDYKQNRAYYKGAYYVFAPSKFVYLDSELHEVPDPENFTVYANEVDLFPEEEFKERSIDLMKDYEDRIRSNINETLERMSLK
jgi:hypothetical protein